MIGISYTLSHSLNIELQEIENLRAKLALFPLSKSLELRLTFEATIERVISGIRFSGAEIPEGVRQDFLLKRGIKPRKKSSPEEPMEKMKEKIIGYKEALDFIRREWLVSNQAIETKTAKRLLKLSGIENMSVQEEQLKQVLDYLQTSSESPVIQAAIAKFSLLSLTQIPIENDTFSTLFSYLFLYKSGYDFRQLLVLERQFLQDKPGLIAQYQDALQKQNLIAWIEYFARAITTDLHFILDTLTKLGHAAQSDDKLAAMRQLSPRQLDILHHLDDPILMITNRMVQKRYKVSQITASRDLASLAHLGLVFRHGKGRSVRYSRA